MATSRSTALPPRSIIASRATAMPRCASRPRSTKARAPSSASISPASSPGRCRSSSTARPGAEGDSRFAIEADLTQAKVDNLLPGWSKPSGRPAARRFPLINKPTTCRFEDLVIEVPAPRSGGRGRLIGRSAVGEFPRLRPVRRRQGHAQGRARQRRHVARDHARRRLRRTRLRQVDDDRPGRQQASTTRISISTSRSAPWWATTARRCAASICGSRGAPASSRAWR